MATVIIKDQTHQDLKCRSAQSGELMKDFVERVIRLELDRPLKSVNVEARKRKGNGK